MAKKTILVIDDDADLLELMRLVLEDEGYREHGEQALNTIAERGVPDAVLLDLRMPVMDGYEFSKRFRGLDDQTVRCGQPRRATQGMRMSFHE